jgi:hypothetical protein
MTVLTFPTNPTNGQRYAAPNGIQYVYDGVKWIVETVASTSLAVTNSVQDRVAPMFVDGDNAGISFTYNAETNTMSAAVTAINGNQLVNGDKTLILDTGGDLTFPSGGKVIGDSQDGTYLQANPGNDGYAGLSSLNGNSWMWTANDGGAYISSSDGATVKSWSFNTDGKLTLPIGGDIVDSNGTTVLGGGNADLGNFTFSDDTIANDNGLLLDTNRGSLAIGTQMELPGVAQHFHIAFNGSNSNPPVNDLFFGDDNNYVKLPGSELNPTAQFGVEIGTNNRSLGPQNIGVSTVDELVPPGGVWRFFIDPETYPNLGSLVSVGDTVTTSWGTPITATITAVVEDPGLWWIIAVAQDITAGFSGGDTVSFGTSGDSNVWRFGTDGKLTLPTNGTISYAPDDTDNWNVPSINTISAALDELALRLKAVENIEIEGGNAYAMAGPELILDGNGA